MEDDALSDVPDEGAEDRAPKSAGASDGAVGGAGPLPVLLDVQAHDLALDRLAYRLRELPERARVEELNRRRAALSQRLDALEATRSELARRQDELEGHVQALVDRIGVIEGRLRSGAVGSFRDQEAMATETQSLDHQRRAYEDREIEIMEELEPVEAELAALGSELDAVAAERASAASQLAEAESSIAAERAEVAAERAPLAAGLPDDLSATYERLRAKLGGIGAAKLVDGTCSGCHLRLPSRERDQVVHAPPGTVFYCDQCGRILVP
ncbi:MAG: C4-type zinc ribbon domain-containing protein [Acidimicrobiales bacterium]